MFTPASASARAELAERARPVLDVHHQHLALVGDAHAGVDERLARGVGVTVGDEQVDVSVALAGERAHPLDVHPGLTGGLADSGQLARPVLEHHCEIP